MLNAIRDLKDSFAGTIDTVIQCACSYGASSRHPFATTSDDEWAELFAINTHIQFVILREVLPDLLNSPRGLLIGISSDVAVSAGPGRVAYSCAKAASHSMHLGLAAELVGTNVAVVQLMPERQVHTPGLEARRPPGYDFSNYQSPTSFNRPVLEISAVFGSGFHGQCLVVHEDKYDIYSTLDSSTFRNSH